jgi:hypothetical protein
MGGKGKSGPQDTNSQIVGMQMLQSQQAANANDQRNARLNYGKNLVQQMFEGRPSGSSPLDLSSITQANAPGQITLANQNPAAAAWVAQHPESAYANPYPAVNAGPGNRKQIGSSGYTWGYGADTGASSPNYAIYDPSGNMIDSASNLSDLASAKIYTGGDPNTKTGGFDDAFYNKYRQSILDYYNPQEGQQYGDARSKLAASLARAGQLDSSTATFDIGRLAQKDTQNRAQIASQADTQTGTLRSTIQQDEQSALNQLYSTEDPSVAANTAGNMVAGAQLAKPMLNPAGALFDPITVGVGNALSGFTNPTAYINPNITGSASTPGGAVNYGQNYQG